MDTRIVNADVGRYVRPMIRWDVAKRLETKAITNANQLAKAAGLSYPVAWRIMNEADEPLTRVDITTLESLAVALGEPNPLKLLKHTKG